MHYQRNLRKRAVIRRILLSWLIVAILSFAIGFGVGKLASMAEDRQNSYTVTIPKGMV